MRLIDADAFIERLREGCEDKATIEYINEIHDLLEIEVEFHPIDAEPTRHGKWTITECFDVKDMTCSSCGWLYEYYAGMEEEWNYCPHCGARMEGTDETY